MSISNSQDEHAKLVQDMKRRVDWDQFRRECEIRLSNWLDSLCHGEAETVQHFEATGIIHRSDGLYSPEVRVRVTHETTLKRGSR